MSDIATIHVHRLSGCRPTPLAHYLKALGVLRLVSEQIDPAARGWWEDDVFHLATRLNGHDVDAFFLHHYSPTPLLAPWNGGSGFYPKDNKAGLEAIEKSTSSRFGAYRHAVELARVVVSQLDAKPDKGESKNGVIAGCRRAWRGPALQWLDAALALGGNGEPVFPAMLGTGGNDGRLEFTTNFMLRLVTLFDMNTPTGSPTANSAAQISTAIWERPSPTLESGAIGQFLPGAAGGPNGTNGFVGSIGVNPWDFVLMLEGAVLFSAGLSRRCQSSQLPQAAAPFAVRNSGAGYASSSASDVGARGEQWMPLWQQPTSLRELTAIIREGKSQINGRPAGRGTDMARAIAKMGVARGIDQFERYGYIERNGLSNLAVPLGRFKVRQRPHQRLLDEVAPWIDRLRQVAADKFAPQSFARAYRACELSVFNCASRASGDDFLNLLVAMAAAEDQMLASPRFSAEKCSPMPRISSNWLSVVEQNSFNYRLALSLSAQHGPLETKTRWSSVRAHWSPLDESGFRFAKGESGLSIGPEQSAGGLDLTRALLSVMHRRLLALNRGASESQVPMKLVRDRFGATLNDIQEFLDRRTDDSRILSYARGLMAIRFDEQYETTLRHEPNAAPLGGLSLFGVFRLAMPVGDLKLPGDHCVQVRCNTTIFRRLQNGDVAGAFQLAARQLSNVGLRPKLQMAIGSQDLGRRLAASMAFGLKSSEWTRLALALTDPQLPVEVASEESVADVR